MRAPPQSLIIESAAYRRVRGARAPLQPWCRHVLVQTPNHTLYGQAESGDTAINPLDLVSTSGAPQLAPGACQRSPVIGDA